MEGIGGLLHVLGDVKGIDELHRVARPVRGQTRLDRVKRAPVGLGTAARDYDIERGALSEPAGGLLFQLADQRGLVRLGHASEVDRSQTLAGGVEERESSHRSLMPRAAHRALFSVRAFAADRAVALLMSWWLRRLGLPAPRLRVLSVLRHHHAVKTRLHPHPFIGHTLAPPHGPRNPP